MEALFWHFFHSNPFIDHVGIILTFFDIFCHFCCPRRYSVEWWEKGELTHVLIRLRRYSPFFHHLSIILTFYPFFLIFNKNPDTVSTGYAPSMHSFFLSLNCSACRWREVHWVLWPTTPITPKWSLFISRNSQLRKTSPRKGRSYARDHLSDFSARPVKISTKKRDILQI